MITSTPPQRVLVLLSGCCSQQENPRDPLVGLLHPGPARVRAVKGDLTNRPARFPRPADSSNCGLRNSDCGLENKLPSNPHSAFRNQKSYSPFCSAACLTTMARLRGTAEMTVARRCACALMRNMILEISTSFDGSVARASTSRSATTRPSTTPALKVKTSGFSLTNFEIAFDNCTGSPSASARAVTPLKCSVAPSKDVPAAALRA